MAIAGKRGGTELERGAEPALLARSVYSLPNLITGARLLATVPVVWLILAGRYDLALWIFVIAALSDAVDGFVAKRFDSRTVLGTWLDPIADKVLLVATYLALVQTSLLPLWMVVLVVLRDLVVASGAVMLQRRGLLFHIQPLTVGKINTLAQILLAAFVLGHFAGVAGLDLVVVGLLYATALLTLVSGGAYLAQGVRMARAAETAPRAP